MRPFTQAARYLSGAEKKNDPGRVYFEAAPKAGRRVVGGAVYPRTDKVIGAKVHKGWRGLLMGGVCFKGAWLLTGSVKKKVAPLPTCDSAQIRPPCAFTIR